MWKIQYLWLILITCFVIMLKEHEADARQLKFDNISITKTEFGRTFGRIKRFQMLLFPIAFKMGVFSTIIGIILALTLKSVMIGKLILLLNLGLIIFKVGAFFSHKTDSDLKKNIHIHFHGGTSTYQGYVMNEPYQIT